MRGLRKPSPILEERVVPGVEGPNGETTYGEMRRMAQDIVDRTHRTPVEKGLAMSLLAVIHDLEHELKDHQR